MSAPFTSLDTTASSARPKDSAGHTPSASAQSSFDFDFSLDEPENDHKNDHRTPSSGEQSPIRGRTLIRIPAEHRLVSRATSRHRVRPSSTDFLDVDLVRRRLLSRDISADPDEYDDILLEPLPFERFRSSLSAELHRAATFDSSIDLTGFGGHRDTFAMIGYRRIQRRPVELPDIFFKKLARYLDFDTYKSVRASCRNWSATISRARPIVLPPVCMLPVEVLERIFDSLSPMDFNAARHTCRAWMIASLEERLLLLMLNRGGWSGAASADAARQEHGNQLRKVSLINDEWLLSQRLATECSLRPDWTGIGLAKESQTPSVSTSLVLVSETDLSELRNGLHALDDGQQDRTLQFTVSVCNKYVLVAVGCVVYVYALQRNGTNSYALPRGGHLQPFTSIVCPHRVLAVSMDTSCNRYAIAALLEGRVCLVCDLGENTSTSTRDENSTRESRVGCDRRTSICSRLSSQRMRTEPIPHTFSTLHVSSSSPGDRTQARAIAEATLPEFHGTLSSRLSCTIDYAPSHTALLPSPLPASPSQFAQRVPLETGPRILYRNLCSTEDPPRSVANCPQRRCVAFGCSAGIELHLIDALSGQDLNRWFPLSAPSDFLYFLPSRLGVDNAKKLRLVSSAAHPGEGDGRGFPGDNNTESRGGSWDEHQGFGSAAVRSTSASEHYHAVPISDGWNVLFTDPESGELCLGTDARPQGGAPKLERRFVFRGPRCADGKAVVPTVYTAGVELRWGVRILVGYGDRVWVFVVPPDIFFEAENLGKENGDGNNDEPKPTRISGVEIGTVPQLVTLAVDASFGDLTLWAFAASGIAYTWGFDGATEAAVTKMAVRRDGTIIAPSETPKPDISTLAIDFDGAASRRHSSVLAAHAATARIIDADGDTVMPDADVDDEGYVSEFAESGGSFAIHAPPLWGRWSEDDAEWVPRYLGDVGGEIDDEEGVGVDVLELCRVECEIIG